mmetsp:Transcript_15710/g.23093  ORF Transcript_15710/g.23093 Transcript_15710/m.23093 type:complete len:204 (-) Transcript_15710:295-906(-)|eukprot:CAMPEP_0113933542 /NCGR_PEP_ID=MMETSP1339-20121228/594_1 /TAXON_ID=94617 /ORGANISM="Fibrocapsa japonica" /LENGTH=203 /DNA_ID=CAMNT_0000934843 /DNA_START=125 /DNA_END=736 /DNA_ORIENTATION=- /assembly_acc=CAM_ASM_000762
MVVAKYMRAFKEWGLKGTLVKMYQVGDIKFGTLKGVDHVGNKYYENMEDYPHGQHRWVEYRDIHNYDAATVPPLWHSWLHHVTDLTPEEEAVQGIGVTYQYLASRTDVGLNTHIGLDLAPKEDPSNNYTTFRQRGFKVGSLAIGPDEEDKYYKQPGHPLHPKSEEGGRNQGVGGQHAGDPNNMISSADDLDKDTVPVRTLNVN